MIIGVTGLYAAGKDSVADILQKMNFFHVSFSDLLREELRRQKKKITRDNLIVIGNELREQHGPDVLARMALTKVKDGDNYVFTSIRNPAEVELLQKRKEFLFVNVTAQESVRLKRILQRNREEDPKTLAELRKKESIENSVNPNNQQMHKVMAMAKIVVVNDGEIDDLQKKVEKLVVDHIYTLQSPRPDWEHYFMAIAEQVKLRCS